VEELVQMVEEFLTCYIYVVLKYSRIYWLSAKYNFRALHPRIV